MKMGTTNEDEAGLGLLVDVRGAGRVFVERLQPRCSAERSNLVSLFGCFHVMHPSGRFFKELNEFFCAA
jgi:hypothetical protein